MSTSILLGEHRPDIPAIGQSPGRAARSDDQVPLSWQLAILPEMLSTLDTLTTAGQRHTMSKVVGCMQAQVVRAHHRLSARTRRTFADLLGHLTRESERLLPDIGGFSRHAESLVAQLALIA